MSKTNNNLQPRGTGFLSLLGLLFIGLKLCGEINWSWWYVTMPLWGVPAALLAIAGLIIIGGMSVYVAELIFDCFQRKK